jgi:hypothetical protein
MVSWGSHDASYSAENGQASLLFLSEEHMQQLGLLATWPALASSHFASNKLSRQPDQTWGWRCLRVIMRPIRGFLDYLAVKIGNASRVRCHG